jgi:hypothetical protein
MRFHLGRFPENTNFNPEAERWFALPTGNINAVHLKTIPVSLGLFLLWLTLVSLVFPSELLTPQVTQLLPNVIRIQYPIFQTPLWPLLAILIAISILFIPSHEMIHALCCPQWGLSANTVFGIWLHKGFFYIHHEEPMSRNHFLLVLVAPYIVLSLLPLAAIGLFRVIGWTPELLITLAWLSLLGSLFASGDFISVGLLLSQVPNAAIVRNKGQRSYWKPAGKTTRTV